MTLSYHIAPNLPLFARTTHVYRQTLQNSSTQRGHAGFAIGRLLHANLHHFHSVPLFQPVTSHLGSIRNPSIKMSLQAGSKPASLTSLPHDVLLHLLDQLTPTQIAAYSQLCRSTFHTASDPSLWASVARRHLGISPTSPPTAASISQLATSLVCRWWLASGLFVLGVPVHFRKGFRDVRAKGGIDVPVDHDSTDSCYVFGGRFKDACVPVALPSVAMDFFLDAAGPFPMDGMTVRLIHASEPVDPNSAHLSDLFLGPSNFAEAVDTPPPDRARIRVKLNNTTIVEGHMPDPLKFSVFDVHIKPEILCTRPRVNTLVVEFDRASVAAYWLREVSIVPTVLPLPKVDDERLKFTQRIQLERPEPPPPMSRVEEPVEEPERTRDPSPRDTQARENRTREARPRETNSPPQSPRSVAGPMKQFVEPQKGKHQRGGKLQKVGRKPKHVYHHCNHYRSPRGSAPASTKGRR